MTDLRAKATRLKSLPALIPAMSLLKAGGSGERYLEDPFQCPAVRCLG